MTIKRGLLCCGNGNLSAILECKQYKSGVRNQVLWDGGGIDKQIGLLWVKLNITQFYLFYLLSDFLDETQLSLLEVAHFHNLYMLFYL